MNKNRSEIVLKGRLNGKQRNLLKGVFEMMYRPSELANELGISVHQFYRVYIPGGCPHERDDRNHIWVNGKAFSEWYQEVYKKRRLEIDQAFCLTCKKAVLMIEPVRKQEEGLTYYICKCPHCNRKIARIVEMKRKRCV